MRFVSNEMKNIVTLAWSMCCVLGQNNLPSHYSSPARSIDGNRPAVPDSFRHSLC